MGKIALSQNTSLDGVMQLDGKMQSPGPTDVPFTYTGWAVEFGGGPEGARFNYGDEVGLEQAQNSEALLLGRVTYEAMQAFWPTAEGELARQAERVAEVRRLLDAHGPGLERDRGRRLAGGSGQTAKGARRRDPRLWQPPPLAGTDRDGGWWTSCAYWSTRWCSVPEVASSARRRTRSRCAWSNRVRSGEAW
jgi:hypothetical protein